LGATGCATALGAGGAAGAATGEGFGAGGASLACSLAHAASSENINADTPTLTN